MKILSTIVFAFFFVCAVQAQRGFPGNRRPLGPIHGGPIHGGPFQSGPIQSGPIQSGPIQTGGGPKSDCATFCPLNYQPTCGFNGRCYKEFSNTCALNAATCLGEGNFRQVNIQECSKRGARTC
ncbi:uncharacterized protein LOC119602091 [Lucilia sericata]|uniref:uncharacterized protein LOC119602091 n=1 Tax=Lucilia sericata TaxID=13632 RepID=UPI0018A822D9|nr:uncharacterized protein LOC119602091 [Lucilia sericata]